MLQAQQAGSTLPNTLGMQVSFTITGISAPPFIQLPQQRHLGLTSLGPTLVHGVSNLLLLWWALASLHLT